MFKDLSEKFLKFFKDDKLLFQPTGVKFILKGSKVPKGTADQEEYQGITWCQAINLACRDNEIVPMTLKNLGCTAAAISLGLVDERDPEALEGKRVYTDMMDTTASPKDFTEGRVYACKHVKCMNYALFGSDDTGRYKTLGAALHAISGIAVVKAEMEGVIAYPPGAFKDETPDIVITPVIPAQETLITQAYAYKTGNRLNKSSIGIRGVCADLTAYPFQNQTINGSTFCLGARAIGSCGKFVLALGMPFKIFKEIVKNIYEMKGGFPYDVYPEQTQSIQIKT